MSDKLIITKRNRIKGEDGYKVFSIRVKDETVNSIDEISRQTDRSRNELINTLLEYALKNIEIQ